MKKLFKITSEDANYPKGIKKEVLKQHFGDQKFAVDIYSDLKGKLFYKININWGNLGYVFVRLAPFVKEKGKLYFQAVDFYHQADNNLEYVNSAYKDYEFWKDTLLKDMPVDEQIYRAYADGEWGYFDILTPNRNGVWCNMAVYRAKDFPAPEFYDTDNKPETFPIRGNKFAHNVRQESVKLGRVYIKSGAVYI